MKKRILAMLMALVMVLSLCPTTAFAAPALPQDLILSDGVTTQQNPLYPDVEYADELMIPDAPISTLATSEDNYGTVEDIAVDIRENMKKRNTEFTVLYHHVAQSSDIEVVKEEIGAAFQEAFDLAIEHTGDPIEGDYLKWQWGRWGYSWSGSYSGSDFYVDFTITLEYYTTAAQEREMDQAVENLLDELDLELMCAVRSKMSKEAKDAFVANNPNCLATYEGNEYGTGWRYIDNETKRPWYEEIAAAFKYPKSPNMAGWYFNG